MRQDDDDAKQFWKSYLKTYDEPTPLPLTGLCQTDVKQPGQTFNAIKQLISRELKASLLQCAQTQAVSVEAILKTAWGILLSKYVNQETVVFGGLNTEETESESSAETETSTGVLPVIINCKADRTLLEEIGDVHQRGRPTLCGGCLRFHGDHRWHWLLLRSIRNSIRRYVGQWQKSL